MPVSSPCQKEEEVGHTPTAAEAVSCHFYRDNVGMRFIRRTNVPTHLGTTKEAKKDSWIEHDLTYFEDLQNFYF
jgi:hypothetical protein